MIRLRAGKKGPERATRNAILYGGKRRTAAPLVSGITLNRTMNEVTGGEARTFCAPLTARSVRKKAFEKAEGPRAVVLNEGIEELEDESFAYSGLELVMFPTTLRKLGEDAFLHCERLKRIEYRGSPRAEQGCVLLPAALEEIGRGAFFHCPKIMVVWTAESTNVDAWRCMGDSVAVLERQTGVGGSLLWDLRGLREVMIPEGT